MARFLTPAWIAELDDAFRDDAALAAATGDVALVIEQEVTRQSDEPVAWHVRIDHGTVRAIHGAAEDADVVFRQDEKTATAIGRGELSAQTAFMVGKLRVTGDVELLMQYHDVFDSVNDVCADVRARTEY